MLVEHRMRQVVARPEQPRRQGVRGPGVQRGRVGRDAERRPHRAQVRHGRQLRAGDPDGVGVHPAHRDPGGVRGRDDGVRPARHARLHRVEERAVHDLDATRPQPGREHRRHPVAALRDPAQPVGAVVDGVAGGDDGEQDLRRADVAGRLLPADVLLAGLQRQPQRRVAVGVAGQPDEPARQLPGERLAHRQVARVRAAEAQRHPEALRGADDGVRPQLAGRGQQRQRQQVRGHGDQATAPVHLLDQRRRVAHHARTPPGTTAAARTARRRAARRPGRRPPARCPAARPACAAPRSVCGSVSASTTKRALFAFPARRSSVIASAAAVASSSSDAPATGRPVRSATSGLEGQQRLQPALADLGLVGRVGGVPGRVLEDVAPDRRRGDRAAVAEPDHRDRDRVAPGERAQLGQRLGSRSRAPAGPRRPRRPGRGSPRAAPGRPARRARRRRRRRACVASSSGRGPMCRSTNGTPCSSSCSVGRGASECSERLTAGLSVGVARLLTASRATTQGEPHAGRNRPPPLSSPGDRAPERFTGPDLRRRWPGFPRRRTAASLPSSLSRGVFPARSWGLRGSGEELLLRRPARCPDSPARGRRPPPHRSRAPDTGVVPSDTRRASDRRPESPPRPRM